MCVSGMPRRKHILVAVETSVLTKSARRCCLCHHLRRDFEEKLGQIAHLDHDPTNEKEDNLAWLCLEHHSLYDSTTSQNKGYTPHEVKAARAQLYEAIARMPRCEWVYILDGKFQELDKERVEALTEHIRKFLSDATLTMKKAFPGSINLVIESSLQAYEKVKRLFDAGDLKNVLGYPVIGVYSFEAAFNSFYEHHWDLLVDYLRGKLNDRAIAEDIANTALAETFKERNLSGAYLYQTARLLVSMHKKQRTLWPIPRSFSSEIATPEERVIAEEPHHALAQFMSALTAHERTVLALYLDDCTVDESAAKLSVSTRTIRRSWASISAKLRQRLGQSAIRRKDSVGSDSE